MGQIFWPTVKLVQLVSYVRCLAENIQLAFSSAFNSKFLSIWLAYLLGIIFAFYIRSCECWHELKSFAKAKTDSIFNN